MKYKNSENQISNAEFALMEIILEKGEISGYDIDTLIEERGFRSWADIGTTSIYMGLDKLKKRGFAGGRLDLEKKGRGPLPRLYSLTDTGIRALRDAVYAALSSPGSRHSRFDLALAGIPILSKPEQIEALGRRRDGLNTVLISVERTYHAQGGEHLPLPARLLFEHSFSQLRNELDFIEKAITEIDREGGRDG
ncbi:MAG: hypothetical protein A2Y33_09200 [Spirochaetes bacterium GWF1_51_8]|nr:MAG: hypothetical protein A2Y33_09200 [Spirochaetes bacterium GWF1_51_8]